MQIAKTTLAEKPMKKQAQLAGLMFLAAIICGIASATLLTPLMTADLTNELILANRANLLAAALLQLLMAFAILTIVLALYPCLKNFHPTLARAALAFRGMEAILFSLSAAQILSLIPLAQLPGDTHLLIQSQIAQQQWLALGPAAMCFCVGAFMYYLLFFQFRLIPRLLSGWGLIAIVLHAVGVLEFLSSGTAFSAWGIALALPILLNELALSYWLMFRLSQNIYR